MKRIVKDIALGPGGEPIFGGTKRASIRLYSGVAWADSGQREVIGTARADLDRATGYWEQELDVNVDLDPPDGYYTVKIGNGPDAPLLYFVVPPGSGPVWLRTCLVDPPTVSPPAVLSVLSVTGSGVDNTDPRNPVITGGGGGASNVALDTDGVPYFQVGASGATIAADTDGVPYFQAA